MSETSQRLLTLLSLLQTPREWPGPELAERLKVSPRTVRNDVDRLRRLGYPVEATRGPIGGYRLAAGTAMPPLLLDDEEAVAVAVALGNASGGGVEGIEESAVQALTKLRQVLPRRLAQRVETLQATTVRLHNRGHGPRVEVALLGLLSAKASDHELLRFDYAAYSGEASRRKVEPYRLVNLGQRWYLVTFDTEKDDWRTFRVDRMADVTGIGHRFKPRELPDEDMAGYVADRTRQVRLRTRATVTVEAPADEVAARMGPWIVGAVEALAPEQSRISLGGRDVESMARWLALLGSDFQVHDAPELSEALRALSDRFVRAAG